MTDQEARYDRIAEGYARWWAPVHLPATLELLDVVAAGEPAVAGGGHVRVLDAGCGTGALTAAMAARWPGARVTGVDLSAGMLGVAAHAVAGLPPSAAERVTLSQASIDHLPFGDGAFDVVTTAFVLQLVPSGHRALRELRRVLRPGGLIAALTWLASPATFAGDAAYLGLLHELGHADSPDVPASNHDDPRDADALAARLRRAGFAATSARAGTLAHAFSADAYAGFLRHFDDDSFWDELPADEAAVLETALLARLRGLPAGALTLAHPIAYATGRRSGKSG